MESKDDENTPPHRSVSIVSILAILVIISTLLIFPQSRDISVSYDNRAITINGQRRILISGAIHYPRSTPQMWRDLIQKAKDGGLDVIETYVFWDGHEPAPGEYYFEERYDLVRFIKIARDAGLYVNLRLGPYICAEWNFGGFPVWLKYVPGISFRTDNEPFKAEMAKFVKKIVDMMKNERLFAWQGGPIILAQIENELGPVEEYAGPGSKEYAAWSAELALDLDVRIPWIMCKQVDAPDPIIDTCNGFYCDGFTPNKPYKPKLWTEAWTGWFTSFGDPVPHRPIEDLAYSVVSFIKNGGSLVSYYMYHGGTNFGRTAGNFIATSYDYDAPIDEFGLIREQKWGHLRDLHKIIRLCEPTLLYGDLTINNHGRNQEVELLTNLFELLNQNLYSIIHRNQIVSIFHQSYVYRLKSGTCVAFLANNDAKAQATIEFNGTKYTLPPWSASILPDCKNEAYNSAKVAQKPTKMKMEEVQKFSWMSFNEQTEIDTKSTFATNGLLENVNVTRNTVNDNTIKTFTTTGLLEQLNLTRDTTDYLWYTTYVNTSKDELFLKNGLDLVISVSSAGPLLHLYVNGELNGIAYGSLHRSVLTYSGNVKLLAGINKISILSVTVGLYNGGTHYENWNYGVLGPVILYGHNGEKLDLSMQSWTYQIGLKGEALTLHSPNGISSVNWGEASRSHPLTWYKAYFDTPEGEDPLALDMSSMGKGIAWVNGHNIGRYWPGFIAKGSCRSCDYRGHHNESVCVTDCGSSSQRWYHIPRSWLNKKKNLFVVFEEWGGDPSGISLVKRSVHTEDKHSS